MRRRSSDSCVAKRVWEYIEPYWQMGSTVVITSIVAFIAIILWVNDVNGYGLRIDKLEDGTSRIEHKLDYLMGRMGYHYREADQ